MPETTLETRNPKLETDLKELASDIVRRAMSGGATAAECVVRGGDEFSTLVRLGKAETLKEADSRTIGVSFFNPHPPPTHPTQALPRPHTKPTLHHPYDST